MSRRALPCGFSIIPRGKGSPGSTWKTFTCVRGFAGGESAKRCSIHLARVAVEKGCGRYQWQVLDWNTPAIKFYESLGAKVMKEWLTLRVSGDALGRLGEQGSNHALPAPS